MAMATAGTPPTLALPVPLEIRAGATARRLPQTVSRVRIPLGFSAISKTCWRCRESRANPFPGLRRPFPYQTGKKQGIFSPEQGIYRPCFPAAPVRPPR